MWSVGEQIICLVSAESCTVSFCRTRWAIPALRKGGKLGIIMLYIVVHVPESVRDSKIYLKGHSDTLKKKIVS